MTHEEQNGLVDQVCHKDQMVIWTSEIAGRLSEESYLKDRLAYSDVVHIHSILEDEVKSIVRTAFDLAALQAPQEAASDPVPSEDEPEKCPICAEPFKPGDICATDITEGMCHAACLEGAAIVDLGTGEPSDGPVTTYPYPAQPEVQAGASAETTVEKLVEIVREQLEIDGDGEGPFIRFDSIEAAVRAVLSATRPAEAQAVPEGWRDMASAPKDGTRILLKVVTFAWSSDVCQHVATGDQAIEARWATWMNGDSDGAWRKWCGNARTFSTDGALVPLGWLPLPAASPATGGA